MDMRSILYSKKTLVSISCFIIGTVFFCASAWGKTFTLGGEKGWSKLSVKKGVTEGKGRYGYTCIELATNARAGTDETDMLLDFEQRPFSDRTGMYSAHDDAFLLSSKAVMGKGAALSRGGNGMLLTGRPGSIFGTEGPVGSFYIEFWLAPSVTENGEMIFSWRSSRTVAGQIMYQMITGMFNKNHLEWTFANVFDGYGTNDGEVTVKGIKTLVPGIWTHHVVSFDEESGRLEYRVDGELESIRYITSTGHESGTVYPVFLGVPADAAVCPKYTGRIDDFRIQRGTYDSEMQDESETASGLSYSHYKTSGGRFETEPILATEGAVLNSVTAVMSMPDQTAVMLYVRSGENCFSWTDDYPEWKPVTSGEKISGVSGLYFQIAAELYPDGTGSKTPSVTQLSADYTDLPVPLPPFKVKAAAGDGSVTLSWSYSVDESAGGYLVYYGTRPGEYLGRVSAQGPSPVDAGNTSSLTLTGLKNGTIYYFAVSAYSKLDSRINGTLSKEVYARPARGAGN